MQKPLIETLLKRYSEGDNSIQEKLCSQLAERLMVVPSLGVEDDAGQIRVQVLQLRVEEQPAVACFTSEKRFKEWIELFGFDYEKLDLLGSDLCTVIGSGKSLLVDPNTEHESILEPDLVQHIIATSTDPEPQVEAPPPFEEVDSFLSGESSEIPEVPSNVNRVFENPEYVSDTLVHGGTYTGSPMAHAPIDPDQTVLQPAVIELPPEAAELPPEVAHRVAKLLSAKNNQKRPSGSVIVDTPESSETVVVPSDSEQVAQPKKRGFFDLFLGSGKK